MNYSETLRYIHSLGKFSLPAGLQRIKKVLNCFNNPQNSFKSIHIAGTNGKGSVCAMLSSVFETAGYKTGLFISPFIIDFRERIQINGEYISEKALTEYSERVKALEIDLTEFEFITAVAFLYFAEQKCDIVICETGLGGRFDATNTLENKAASVITKIGLDHTAILGDTIEKIAEEKCGILRDCPTIINPNQKSQAFEVIKRTAKELIVPDNTKLEILQKEGLGSTFIYKGNKYEISLCGDYQVENAVTAIETINNCGYDIPYTYIYKGLKSAHFPARMEVVNHSPLVIIDGAHNPDGGEALSKELEKYSGKVTAIIGMMRDKDCEEFLKRTLKHCKGAVAVEVKGMPRSLKAQELKGMAEKYSPCIVAESYSAAMEKAYKEAGSDPIFVFGSLYLAAEMRKLFKS